MMFYIIVVVDSVSACQI